MDPVTVPACVELNLEAIADEHWKFDGGRALTNKKPYDLGAGNHRIPFSDL